MVILPWHLFFAALFYPLRFITSPSFTLELHFFFLLKLAMIPVWYFHPIFSNNWFILCMKLTHIFISFRFIFMIFLIFTFHLHWGGGLSFVAVFFPFYVVTNTSLLFSSHALPLACWLVLLFLWLLSTDARCLSWSPIPSPSSRFWRRVIYKSKLIGKKKKENCRWVVSHAL